MNAQSVWVTGAAGLIGNYLLQTAPRSAPGWKVIGLTRQQVDLTDFQAVAREFHRHAPAAAIHCAGISRSQQCQADPTLARKVNVEVTANLAELASRIPFVFFSTDLVFDGRAGNYDEGAAVNPLSVYAETKVAAEQIVLADPAHTVIRTSLNSGASTARNRAFNEEIRNAWQAGQTLHLFTDEFRSPIPAQVTAQAVWELLIQNRTGLYHVAGSERLSRWQIGQLLSQCWPEINARIEPASIAKWQGAPRPPDTSLNCAKAQAVLPFLLPRWSECVKQLSCSSSSSSS